MAGGSAGARALPAQRRGEAGRAGRGGVGLIEGRGNGIAPVKLNLLLPAVYIAAVMFYVGCLYSGPKMVLLFMLGRARLGCGAAWPGVVDSCPRKT